MLKTTGWKNYKLKNDAKSLYKRITDSEWDYDVKSAVNVMLNNDLIMDTKGNIIPVDSNTRRKNFDWFVYNWIDDDYMPF